MKKYFFILLAILLSGCNFPLRGKITPTPNITQAYETIIAQMSTLSAEQTANPGTPVATTTLPPNLTVIPMPTGVSNPTIPVIPIIPTEICDRANPGSPLDVSIPDDSVITSGTEFTKTWRLQNGGACTWTKNYRIVWVSGDKMGAELSYPLPDNVAPGKTIDISIDFTAPVETGTIQSNWMLQNESGVYFGIGPTGKSPFWVRILVQPKGTPTVQPSATPLQPGIIYSGVVTLNKDQAINTSTGEVNSSVQDLIYDGTQIVPASDAGISAIYPTRSDYATCKTQTYSQNQTSLNSETLYGYFCYKNGRGHISIMRILNFENNDNLVLDIQTWGSN